MIRPGTRPRLSVIVPAHNSPAALELCLQALDASSEPHERILVDDASTDIRAIAILKAAGRYHRMPRNSGPAAARNAGAALATGDILVFVDSDVAVQQSTLRDIVAAFQGDPAAAALFGSYDDAPQHTGLVSRYRNLLHHFVHQNGPREASTFWAGCGAIRRDVFERIGGFDVAYRHPSIEDIELGMRLRAQGELVLLLPHIQCKHLKRWSLFEMVRVDVMRRAIPWTRLLIERPGTGGDLNLEPSQKLSVVLVFLALAALAAGLWVPPARALVAWWTPAALLAPVLWIHRPLYGLFARRGGPALLAAGVALHLLYFLYGGLAFAYVQLTHRRRSRRGPRASPARLS